MTLYLVSHSVAHLYLISALILFLLCYFYIFLRFSFECSHNPTCFSWYFLNLQVFTSDVTFLQLGHIDTEILTSYICISSLSLNKSTSTHCLHWIWRNVGLISIPHSGLLVSMSEKESLAVNNFTWKLPMSLFATFGIERILKKFKELRALLFCKVCDYVYTFIFQGVFFLTRLSMLKKWYL